jgi:hypothetical protein
MPGAGIDGLNRPNEDTGGSDMTAPKRPFAA